MNENGPYRVNLNEATMKAIDEELGDHATKFAAIVDEYISLNIEKGEFTNGFMGENPSMMLHVQTVNSIFVSRYLRRLTESILLGICRLTDGYKRATGISRLPEMIAGSDHAEIERLVNEAIKAAGPTIKKIETWRNKRIAHRDTDWLDREIPKPTVDATLETIAKIGEPIKAVWKLKLGSRQDIETLEGYETHALAGAASQFMNEHLTEADKVLAKTAGTLAEAVGQRRTTEIGDTIQAVRHMFETAANMRLCKPLSDDGLDVLDAFFHAAQEAGKRLAATANARGRGPTTAHKPKP